MMRIDLGQHTTDDRKLVNAWIEPNFPAYRAGAVRDHGLLCVQEAGLLNAKNDSLHLRLENMSEDAEALRKAVGVTLAQRLWEERQKYDDRPFYYVQEHSRFGRLYFEPYVLDGGLTGIAISTRATDGSGESVALPVGGASRQIRTLFEHHALHPIQSIPDASQISQATHHGKAVSLAVAAAQQQYVAFVDWDFDNRLIQIMLGATGREPLTNHTDIARYDALSQFAIRPLAGALATSSAEYIRWHDECGQQRLEPLTVEALQVALRKIGWSHEAAEAYTRHGAVSSSDWTWLKAKRLGRMRPAFELLHELIAHESASANPDQQWLKSAFPVADFCSPLPASPSKVFAVLSTVPNYAALPPQLRTRVSNVLDYMANPASGLAVKQVQPSSKLLDALHELNDSSIARWRARCANDQESVETETQMNAAARPARPAANR